VLRSLYRFKHFRSILSHWLLATVPLSTNGFIKNAMILYKTRRYYTSVTNHIGLPQDVHLAIGFISSIVWLATGWGRIVIRISPISRTFNGAFLARWVLLLAANHVRNRHALQTLSPRGLLQSAATQRPSGPCETGFRGIGNRNGYIRSLLAREQMPQHVVLPFQWLVPQPPSRKVGWFSS